MAAKQFSEAYDTNLIPMDFVNKMRSEHKLIMGIGHRVKSVSKNCKKVGSMNYIDKAEYVYETWNF